MASKAQLKNQIKTLEDTTKWFKKQIEPSDCGWMYTTIDGIKYRIKVLKRRLRAKEKGKWIKEKHWSDYLWDLVKNLN